MMTGRSLSLMVLGMVESFLLSFPAAVMAAAGLVMVAAVVTVTTTLTGRSSRYARRS